MRPHALYQNTKAWQCYAYGPGVQEPAYPQSGYPYCGATSASAAQVNQVESAIGAQIANPTQSGTPDNLGAAFSAAIPSGGPYNFVWKIMDPGFVATLFPSSALLGDPSTTGVRESNGIAACEQVCAATYGCNFIAFVRRRGSQNEALCANDGCYMYSQMYDVSVAMGERDTYQNAYGCNSLSDLDGRYASGYAATAYDDQADTGSGGDYGYYSHVRARVCNTVGSTASYSRHEFGRGEDTRDIKIDFLDGDARHPDRQRSRPPRVYRGTADALSGDFSKIVQRRCASPTRSSSRPSAARSPPSPLRLRRRPFRRVQVVPNPPSPPPPPRPAAHAVSHGGRAAFRGRV